MNHRPTQRRSRIASTIALFVGSLLVHASVQAAAPERSGEGPWAKGRVLVMPKPGLTEVELNRIAQGAGAVRARKLTANGIYAIELPGNASESGVANRLKHNPHLKFAELDYQVVGTGPANDPYFGSAWHLGRIGAATAWDTTTGAGVTVAILDTGVDGSHPDLSARMLPGWNFVDGNSNTSDVNGHGTGVAGAAAATINNSLGVASVAGSAKILPVRIADANAYAYWSTIAQGVTWAADNGARVINISYDQLPLSSAVISASNYAKSKGSLVVVAAGNRAKNEGFTPTTSMIPVSATESTDTITTWSSWGNYVAVSAPGQNIWSTTRGGGYAMWYGTSVASPVAAGVVALMMSANPRLSSTQVESLLFSSATDLGASGRDAYYGYGRVNADAAVAAAKNAGGSVSDTQPPSVSIAAPLAWSTVSGLAVVDVSAVDNVAVTKVELRANGALIGTDTSAPFSFSWDTSKVSNGTNSLVARACDAANNCADSAVVSVNVSNSGSTPNDTTPPVVSIWGPADGSNVTTGSVTIGSSATDDSGAGGISMTLTINGAVVATSNGTGSLTYKWNTRKLAAGSYQIVVTARDAAGNNASRAVTVSSLGGSSPSGRK